MIKRFMILYPLMMITLIIFVKEYSNNVTLFGGEMGIFNVDLDKINVDDFDFNKDETGSRILSD